MDSEGAARYVGCKKRWRRVVFFYCRNSGAEGGVQKASGMGCGHNLSGQRVDTE